jgi:NhaP-type Na+/H+ or K+/H+ antiporter
MLLVLVFAVVLLAAVFLSAIAQRTILSTAVLFLLAGYLAGPGLFGIITISADDPVVARFAELALFSILYTDGLRLGTSTLRRSWQLPGRALLVGLPLTLVAIFGLAHWIAGAPWLDAWLIAAALSPTDPVFASALIGHSGVPARLRHLLNVESGLNDGLALPIVVGLLAVRGATATTPMSAVTHVVLGTVLGGGIAWCAALLRRYSIFEVTKQYAPLGVLAIALLTLSLSSLTGANEFLASFVAGVTLAVKLPRARKLFEPFGEPLSEVLKLAALLLFGATLSPELVVGLGARGFVFAALALLVARPAAMVLSLIGSSLSWRETAAAAWFGPKGFASVFFALMILKSGIPRAAATFELLALTIAISMIAHSSTDVLVARWFTEPDHP